jgi:hypothetical protein
MIIHYEYMGINMSGIVAQGNPCITTIFYLLCVPMCLNLPVILYLWHSTVSYIMESNRSHSEKQKCSPKWWNFNSTKAFDIFSCTFLVVRISTTRTWELNSHHQQSQIWVGGTCKMGCCLVPQRDCILHHYHHHLSAMQPLAPCLTPWLWWIRACLLS